MPQIALAILQIFFAALPAQEVAEDFENQEVVFYEEEANDVVIYEDTSYEDQEYFEEEVVFEGEEGFTEDFASFEED